MGQEGFSILILGAGKATRFRSEHPKLLHVLAGRWLGEYVLRTAVASGAERVYMIIGYQANEMRKAFARPGLEFIEQKEQLGTGHALMVARPELERCPSGVVVALVGDAPLLQPETLRALVATHHKERAACTILTTRVDNPTGYGRIVRGPGKRVRAIVEEKVANAAQKKIREINTGILCFSRQPLLAHLAELSRANAQKEYLLTDLIEIFNRHRLKVAAYEAPAGEAWGINDRAQLAEVGKTLRLRKAHALMSEGVSLTDPDATYIDEDVVIGPDSVIEPGVSLRGRTSLGSGCRLEPYSTITDSILADGVTVRQSCVITNCEIGEGVTVGPFAHSRDGAVIEPAARIGKGSYPAAGSTITEDVPPESLAIGRGHQVNKEGWKRERKKSQGQSKK